ncbi:MAG: alpha/beta fold hydrolase [Actinomycetes bacterium]
MSIPPFLAPPEGVTARTVPTALGPCAVLDNEVLVRQLQGSALLVPGFTGSKEDFIAVLAPLADRGIRALALDLAGQFESPVASGSELSLASFAAAVVEIAGSLPRPMALVGHSFGGLVVREAVLSDPRAAEGLVFIASGPAAIPARQQQVLQKLVQVMDGFGLEAVWQGKRAMDAAAGLPIPAPEIDEFLTRRFFANDPTSLTAMVDALCSAADLTDKLAAIAPRSLVIIGELDDVWPLEEQRHMASRLGATVVSLPAVGHSPAVEAPEEVANAIAALLTDNE